MARNTATEIAASVWTAVEALRLKRHHLTAHPDWVEIHQPGKPVLILTAENARRFAHQIEEAQHE